jgi:hypothetical protein
MDMIRDETDQMIAWLRDRDDKLCTDAAAEIERLRALAERAQAHWQEYRKENQEMRAALIEIANHPVDSRGATACLSRRAGMALRGKAPNGQ